MSNWWDSVSAARLNKEQIVQECDASEASLIITCRAQKNFLLNY